MVPQVGSLVGEKRAALAGGQEPEHSGRDDDRAHPGGNGIGGRVLIAGDHELVVADGQAAAGPVSLPELARDADEVGARSGEQPGSDGRGSYAPAGGQLIPWPPGAL